MRQDARLDLSADRFTAFPLTLAFEDEDLSGASFTLQVRDRKDGGALRADLGTVTSASAEGVRLIYAGTDTVANHIAAGRIDAEDYGDYAPSDNLTLSLLGLRINETTMEAMPFGTERGDDLDLFWGLHITPSGGIKEKPLSGVFTVLAGANEA